MSPAPHPLEPDEHRRARHLFVLKSLTDRGYTLAMKAADHAETQLDEPESEPEAPPPPNHHQTFERYVRLIRLLIGLEHRIAHNAVSAPSRTYRSNDGPKNGPDGATPDRASNPADPRRPILHQFIHQATRNSPGRAALRREATALADEGIDRDPAYTVTAAEILHGICEEYGFPFDISKLPDAFLESATLGPVGPVRYNEAGHPIVPAQRMAPSG